MKKLRFIQLLNASQPTHERGKKQPAGEFRDSEELDKEQDAKGALAGSVKKSFDLKTVKGG